MSYVTRMRAAALATIVIGLAPAAGHAADSLHRSDPRESSLRFTFEQAGAKVQGRFEDFAATLTVASGDEPTALEVLVQSRSLDTQDKDRDTTLRGADLFAVAKFPTASFRSTRIERQGAGAAGPARSYVAVGRLTIRDVAREVRLPFTLASTGPGTHELRGDFTLRRLDYGVGQGEWRSTQWVGNEVIVSYVVTLRSTASRPVARLTP